MRFNWQSFLVRVLGAIFIVFSLYNPTQYCYVHWAMESGSFDLIKAFVGLILLILFGLYARATLHSLGWIGIGLAVLLFGLFFAILMKYHLLTPSNLAMQWGILLIISLVLAAGVSWSHIWRRLTGQLDVETNHP